MKVKIGDKWVDRSKLASSLRDMSDEFLAHLDPTCIYTYFDHVDGDDSYAELPEDKGDMK